jgi:hypothetical protein
MGHFLFLEAPMTKVKNYRISKESTNEMIAAGRFNPSLEIIFRDRHGTHRHKLSAGYGDDIHVYREAGLTCVLSINNSLGYVGLEVFEGSEQAGDIFLQENQVTETLGRMDLAPSPSSAG